jgi:cell division protein FtsW
MRRFIGDYDLVRLFALIASVPLFASVISPVTLLCGVLIAYIAFRVPVTFWQRIAGWLLPLSLLLLLVPLVTGLGESASPAPRGVALSLLKFERAQFVRIAVVIFMAGYISRHEHMLKGFVDGVVKPIVLIAPVVLLLFAQHDFGSAVVIIHIIMMMGVLAGVPLRHVFLGLTLILVGFAGFSHCVAILAGSGIEELWGIRIGYHRSAHGFGYPLNFQPPLPHPFFILTDKIYAATREDLRFFAYAMVVPAFLAILWRGGRLQNRYGEDSFRLSLTIGLTALIVVTALVNFGVETGELPRKGIVLPLIGYDGASLIAFSFCVGLLLGLARDLNNCGEVQS